MTFTRRTTKKGHGRPKGSLSAKSIAIREAVLELAKTYDVMTVRQVFYALTVTGIVPKDENAGYRPVQRQVLQMRREGLLDWAFIADATRWQRKPTSYDSVDDALAATARTYRRNLWRQQNVRVEVWLEKDALAGVVMEATRAWDVALMVSRGTSSATFLYESAQLAHEAYLEHGVSTLILTMYDFDAAGDRCHRTVERGLHDYAPDADIAVTRLAVTEAQIAGWKLPTRPAKASDPEAHKFGAQAVELDAIPPNKLITLVEDTIINLIDPHAWSIEQAYEAAERELLAELVT